MDETNQDVPTAHDAPPEGFGLVGKVAIVTGGGAADDGIGNGRAAALLMARAGAWVAVVDRELGRAQATVAGIEAAGGQGLAVAADVTRSDDCERVVALTQAQWSRVDILDNNVGIGSRGSVLTETYERWREVIRVNVDSMFLMSRATIPAMLESGDGGAIVNVSSISAIRPRGLTAYTTSKGAVISLTQAMAVDHGVDGIRVNCVLPGPVYTPMVYGHGMSSEARNRRRDASVLQTEGTGWDIGQAVLYLASPLSRYVTGQSLIVDGGVTLKGPERGS